MGGGFHSHNTTCSPLRTFDTADPPPLCIGAFSPLLIRTERAKREREGTGPGGRTQSGSCFAGLGTRWLWTWVEILCFVVSKGNQEAGGLASLVQCSWIPAVTVAGTILGIVPCANTHPPYIPGQSLANESFEVSETRVYEWHWLERSSLQVPERKLILLRTYCWSSLSNFLIWRVFPHFSLFESFDIANMMIKEASLREDPDLRGELAFLARGCDFVLPSRFKKRLKSFQQAQVSSQPL